jgi:hypothetical protein
VCVLAEAISVIVRVDRLEERFPGGTAAYAALIPNRTYCTDGCLTRVGFMHPSDVERWMGLLAPHGLALDPLSGLSDACVVVDQFGGPTRPCSWIEFSHHPEGYSYCWLTGSDPGDLAAPGGWRPSAMVRWSEGSRMPGAMEVRASQPVDPTGTFFTAVPVDDAGKRRDNSGGAG